MYDTTWSCLPWLWGNKSRGRQREGAQASGQPVFRQKVYSEGGKGEGASIKRNSRTEREQFVSSRRGGLRGGRREAEGEDELSAVC